ncbi:MAG: fatty acid--CoA ligase family protein [Burkholderiaceae bacterium]|nr:fatty acid--CoA ligase family protein [Burkholderiaceae bacterium]
MFHMVSIEHGLHVLGLGGKVFIVDGADIERIVELVASEPQWWLVLIPGMIEPLVAALRDRNVRPRGLKLIGALADLVPARLIGEASRLLHAPHWNTFGPTETGMLPAAGSRHPIRDRRRARRSFQGAQLALSLAAGGFRGPRCRLRRAGRDRGARTDRLQRLLALADEVNAREFRGGWFHMGDMFVENAKGRLAFVDRAKYLIKSGGENIYPIEIERALMAEPRVAEAVVVRRRDPKWGEVPVAFVALKAPGVDAAELARGCRERLSSYKLPREIRFVASQDDFPRSTSGKVQRQQAERWLGENAS